MPQLFSRMDDLNWVTPSISDILDQGSAPPGGDGSIREQMLMLQRKLGELDTPARVINVRPTPSFTMFIAKPDIISSQGNRRAVTINEIKRSIGQIAEEHSDWTLGFLPQLQEVEDAVGILLRTKSHQPLSLRRLMVRTTFRNHTSTMAFAIGNTLEQQLMVCDVAEVGNIFIAGKKEDRDGLLRNLVLSLINLNTPGELRMVIAGSNTSNLKRLVNTPHALGRILTESEEAIRLLSGLVKEQKRRQQWFEEDNVSDLVAYNKQLKETGKTILPRIVILIDSLSDEGWVNTQNQWVSQLAEILQANGNTGIHVVFTADEAESVPESLNKYLKFKIITRSVGKKLVDDLSNFHGSLVPFIDAFIANGTNDITPIETSTVSEDEIEKTVSYWQEAVKQRTQQTNYTRVSGKTGVTGVLKAVPNEQTTEIATPTSESSSVETSLNAQTPKPTDAADSDINEFAIQQAQALAAYLGWIGAGPLQDILQMSPDQAKEMIQLLQKMGIVEQGNNSTPRFIRGASN